MEEVKDKELKVGSREWQKVEYFKCASDPVYFLKNYCYIQHQKRGKIKFELYDFQEKTLNSVRKHKYNIILKSRQLGISTLTSGYSAWLILFNADKSILVVATKAAVAKNLIDKVRIILEMLPDWLKPIFIENNKQSIKLSNDSLIKAVAATPDAGRSESLSLLIIDEAAFIDENLMQKIWASVHSTLDVGGDCIVLSCVTKDTLIFTDKGIKEIGSFINTNSDNCDYKISDYNIMGKDKLRQGNLFHNNGKVPTKKIISKHSELEGSYNHKLWAYSDEKKEYDWFRLDELTINDYICCQKGMMIFGNNDDCSDFVPSVSPKIKNIFNPKVITEDLAYLMGLYISEGSAYKSLNNVTSNLEGGSIAISCGDDISEIFNKLNLKYYHDEKDIKVQYSTSGKNLIEFFEYVGFDLSNLSYDKKIPDKLLGMSEKNIKALLQGIFDGDGCICKHNVNLVSTSEILINQVRMLLLNFGILSSKFLKDKDQMNSYGGWIKHNRDSYVLEIYGESKHTYIQKINFRLNRKKLICDEYVLSKRNNTKDVIPNSIKLVKRLYELSKTTTWKLIKNHNLCVNGILNYSTPHKSNNISKNLVISMYNLYSHLLPVEEKIYWDKVVNTNTTWSQIKQIIDGENETYDFSLPEKENDFWCHSVLYNGIIGHQSPNGTGSWFHSTWTEAEAGINDFNTIKLPWWVHPDHDKDWRAEQDRSLKQKAPQECFSGDVIIYTKNGPKYIKDIDVDDIVLSHDGTYNKVVKVFSHESNNIYKIYSTQNHTPKYVTGNHPFLSSKDEWIYVKNITNDDLIKMFPLNIPTDKDCLGKLILSKENENFKRIVYNFEVENTHTYVTEYGIVHNCDCIFLAAGGCVISFETLNWYSKHIQNPIEKRLNDELWIWEYPQPGARYIIPADIARGDGTDFSTFQIINMDTLDQVGEYKGKIGTTEFSRLLINIAIEYNYALLAPENTGVGYTVCRNISDAYYENLYYHNKDAFSTNINKIMRNELSRKNDDVPGFSTSGLTRPLIVEKLQTMLEERIFKLRSIRLLNELYVFIWKASGKPEAQSGYNDDLVLATCIGLMVRDLGIRISTETEKISRDLLQTTEKFMMKNNFTKMTNNTFQQYIPGARGEYMDLTQFMKNNKK